jgi:hypothetical protein
MAARTNTLGGASAASAKLQDAITKLALKYNDRSRKSEGLTNDFKKTIEMIVGEVSSLQDLLKCSLFKGEFFEKKDDLSFLLNMVLNKLTGGDGISAYLILLKFISGVVTNCVEGLEAKDTLLDIQRQKLESARTTIGFSANLIEALTEELEKTAIQQKNVTEKAAGLVGYSVRLEAMILNLCGAFPTFDGDTATFETIQEGTERGEEIIAQSRRASFPNGNASAFLL